MLAWVSPSTLHYEETLNTLKYAARARKIQNPAKRNVKEDKKSIAKVKKMISELKMEVAGLKSVIEEYQNSEPTQEIVPVFGHNRRNSFTKEMPQSSESTDFMDVLCYAKSITAQKRKTETLKKFLKYEFIQLQNICLAQNSNEDTENIKVFFEEFLRTLKDKVRLVNNKKEIEAAAANEQQLPSEVNLDQLLIETQSALETNEEDTEQLICKIKDKLNILSNSEEKENTGSNITYLQSRQWEIKKEKLDLKIENLRLKNYLATLREKYDDDFEIVELQVQKQELRSKLQDNHQMVESTQQQIFDKKKEICEFRKKATSNINNLVIHFQTEQLSEVSYFNNSLWHIYRCKVKSVK